MTLRSFLDAGYAVLIEEYQRLGMNLMEALDKTAHLRATTTKEDEPRVDPTEAVTARQNEEAFNQFKQMMDGVQT